MPAIQVTHRCSARGGHAFHFRLLNRKSVRCSWCQKRVSVPRPAKPRFRAQSQTDAQRAHRLAVQQFDKTITKIKRAVTSLSLWRRRIDHYAAEAAITDEQRAVRRLAQAEQREERRRRRRRERKVVT